MFVFQKSFIFFYIEEFFKIYFKAILGTTRVRTMENVEKWFSLWNYVYEKQVSRSSKSAVTNKVVNRFSILLNSFKLCIILFGVTS